MPWKSKPISGRRPRGRGGSLDPGHPEKRRRAIYFCEDPAGPDGPAGLPLLTHGSILQLRRNKGRDDTTVKLRPWEDSQVTQRWINECGDDGWEFRVEGDWATWEKNCRWAISSIPS